MKEPFTAMEYRIKLKNNLERIPGVKIPDERIEKRPNFEIGLLNDTTSFDIFAKTMTTYIEDIKVSELDD